MSASIRVETYSGSRRVIVNGITLDEVRATAQRTVDEAPPESDPEMFGPDFDTRTGSYRAVAWLRTRTSI
ncbi:hypothetical protein AB4Y45_25510 [Paraburkholderia sp. EG287A]|uniref:hypothetical protein n=1 Tax=unclassified Paraburkholderia TaxID=2615204 RepID=UPI0034D174E7